MDVVETIEVDAGPSAVFARVGSLDEYPEWLEIVRRTEEATAVAGDDLPAWTVDLRGRLGPLSRAKRLRMVRTDHEAPHRVTFERREVDGKSHAPWVLRAEVEPTAGGSRLTMRLHYGGGLWGSVLERMLRDVVEHSRPRLTEAIKRASG